MSKVLNFLNIPLGLLILITFSNCSQSDATYSADMSEPTLTKLWETTGELTTCESVLHDEDSDRIFVSNINGGPSDKNGQGFISIIDRDGNIEEKDWATGLNAPKGMAIADGKLYVTDIDELVEIDLEDGSITNRYPVEGAEFLNDVASDGSKVYFSDMKQGKIHLLENGELSEFAQNQENINGLQFDDQGNLFGLDKDGLKKYDRDGNAEVVNSKVLGGDGLIHLEGDKWLASRWVGEVYLIDGDTEHKLLDTTAEESNTADIGYIHNERILLVPTFFKNKVVAYQLDY
jgi:DNA-binding beta-propeller fold protein YncE